MFMAGGSLSNEVRFFDATDGNTPFAAVLDFEKAVLDVDFSHMGSMAAVACGDGTAKIYNLTKMSYVCVKKHVQT
jgi:WD40 repeat protein